MKEFLKKHSEDILIYGISVLMVICGVMIYFTFVK